MSITAAEAAAANGLADLLVESKITVPERRRGVVSRREIVDRLVAEDSRVVSVSAPAGFGKTTLLTEWARRDSRATGWVTLEAADDDPTTVLSLIARASARFSPLAASLSQRMGGIGSSSLSRAAPLLAAALAAAPEPFILFLDDAHLAGSTDCQDVLEVVLSRVPAGSQVVLASRREPALLARLRASGAAVGASVRDLALDAEGARAVFAGAGVAVTEADLDAVLKKTEGWPAGLSLSAQILRADGDVSAIGGEHQYLADYLYRECLVRQPERLRVFLRRAAVLESFSAAFCGAVLDRDDAFDLLRQTEAARLFLTPIDRRRGWFRFHALFREFLLADLEQAEGAAAVDDLHRRAATWLLDNRLPDAAVEHLLSAGDRAHAAEIVADHALVLYDQGRMRTIRRWVELIGDSFVRGHPRLAVVAAWITALAGEVAEGERCAHLVSTIELDHVDASQAAQIAAECATFQAARCAHGPEQALVDARLAVSHHPTWNPWHAVAVHLEGTAHIMLGAPDAARSAFRRAVDLAEATGIADPAVLSEPELALLAVRAGRLVEARAHADRGVELVLSTHLAGYAITGLALAVGARLALRDQDELRARRLLNQAMRTRAHGTYLVPYLAVRVRQQLAKAYASLGELATARHLLHELDEVFALRPHVGELADDVRRFGLSLDGESPDAGSPPLTPAELRLLPYLQTHLTIAEIGERLFVSRNTVSSEVSSIYRKLGATTRSAAVTRATALGMLGD